MSFPNVGFRGRDTVLWVDSERIIESMAAARLLGVTYVGISPKHGYHRSDLEFLADYPAIQRLFLPFAGEYDLRPLSGLRSLRHLTISESRADLTLTWFPMLEELQIDWHSNIDWHGASALRDVFIRRYASPAKDLSNLPSLSGVERLELAEGNIESLAGIERYRGLTHLEIHHFPRLSSVCHLCGLEDKLQFVHFGSCRLVRDWNSLSCLSALSTLRLNDCGKIPSLAFLYHLHGLKEFRFVKTIVEDGNLEPLLQLDTVGFNWRKGYSHTPEQIDELITSRKR